MQTKSAPDQKQQRCVLCGNTAMPWRRKRGFQIFGCDFCGNAFVPSELIPSNLEELYSKSYFEGSSSSGYPSYLADQALLAKNFEQRLTWIRTLAPSGKRLLDVGAAYGLFLKAARASGWEASGVEIAPDCAREAERISGSPVTAGDFSTVRLHGNFDVIVMLDVIEHLRDPMACVARARELLAPGGLLVIDTGDRGAPWARLLGSRWYFLDPPQHLFYFSRRGLTWLVTRCGFSPRIELCRPGRRVSLANICFKLAAELPEPLKRPVLTLSRRGLPGSFYLNFGDGMLVAARRAA